MKTLPCPNCGEQPRLIQDFKYARENPKTDESCYLLKYECRKLFGLLFCFGVKDWHWIEKSWYSVGVSEASRKWNELVKSHEQQNNMHKR